VRVSFRIKLKVMVRAKFIAMVLGLDISLALDSG
jgi:antitoxin component of RelBE/YafQ-DinJ toxin-antitoxin module